MTGKKHRCVYVSCESGKTSNLKRCAGCRSVWYCSTACQKADWKFHVFHCKAGEPVSTIHHLARAMAEDVVPVDPQTRRDYGFEKAERLLGPEAGSMLCGVYQGLLRYLAVPREDVRRWQMDGRLMDGIKAAFEPVPPECRGEYYPWLLQHAYILDGTPAPFNEDVARQRSTESVEQVLRNAWTSIGGSPRDTADMIRSKKAAWPANKQDCFVMYSLALGGSHPNPVMQIWLSFGFVAAKELGEEQEFGRNYAALVRSCTFNELHEAYETSTIPQLFDRHNIHFHNPRLFADVMAGSPRMNKSVWDLKQYVDGLTALGNGEAPLAVPSASYDYGYVNCSSPSDRKLLDDLYKYLLVERHRDVDPLELHQACLQGKLLEFAKRFRKLAPHTAKYQRLLRNPYPLFISSSGVRQPSGRIRALLPGLAPTQAVAARSTQWCASIVVWMCVLIFGVVLWRFL